MWLMNNHYRMACQPPWQIGLLAVCCLAGCGQSTETGFETDVAPTATLGQNAGDALVNESGLNNRQEDSTSSLVNHDQHQPEQHIAAQVQTGQGGTHQESEDGQNTSDDNNLLVEFIRQIDGNRLLLNTPLSVKEGELLGAAETTKGPILDLLLDGGIAEASSLAKIAQMESVEHLRIRETEIGDQGAAILADGKLKNLEILNLPHANLSAKGIIQLAKIPRLRQLRLGGKRIDDEAVKELTKLSKLQSLHLIGPTLSDMALDWLASSPKLVSFYLDDCPLSDAAWQRLFDAKPTLHVHIDQAHHDRDPKKGQH